jgi:hypothetical protein
MRILVWHAHAAWMTSFVHGDHTYLVPATPDHGEFGRGRAPGWPDSVVEVYPTELATAEVDLVVLQRPQELELAERWLRRRPGRDIPAVYVEHDTPKGNVPETRHPMADRDDIVLIHVTHFNDLFWASGTTRRAVIEHGVPEPMASYSGELERIAVVIDEPARHWRVAGTDLLPRFAEVAPVDVFGFGAQRLHGWNSAIITHEGPQAGELHAQLASRRLYLHPFRWTSLDLTLLESMMIGMPVVALATTEAMEAVPEDAGVLSTQVDVLVDAAQWLISDPESAVQMGKRARLAAQRRYSLDRFLADWDRLALELTG